MNLVKIVIPFLFLASCVEVGFKNPQPSKGTSLTEIPEEMIAFYSGSKSDSTTENKNGLSINDYYDKDDLDKSLSESTILKKWKGNYFLNQQEENLWHIIMIKPIANGNFETYNLDGSNEKTIALLKEITDVKEVFDEDGELDSIVLDPSLKEFKKIVKSGAFEIIEIF